MLQGDASGEVAKWAYYARQKIRRAVKLVAHPNSVEGVNLEAATLVSLGQSINAKAKLSQYRGDSIVDENLARLL